MQISIWLWVVIGLLFIFGVCWIRKRCDAKESFFGGNSTLTVSWQPPANYQDPTNVTYQYYVYPGANPPGQDPTQWGAPMGTDVNIGSDGTVSAYILSSLNGFYPAVTQYDGNLCNAPNPLLNFNDPANANTCDLGEVISFAVQAVDSVSGTQSGWTITQINLQSQVPYAQSDVSITDASGLPLANGSSAFTATANIPNPDGIPLTVYAFIAYGQPANGQASYETLALPAQGGVVSGSFSDPTIWQGATIPGPLNGGTLSVYFYATSPTNQVYFYSSTVVSISNATPSAPTGITWSIST